MSKSLEEAARSHAIRSYTFTPDSPNKDEWEAYVISVSAESFNAGGSYQSTELLDWLIKEKYINSDFTRQEILQQFSNHKP